MVYGGGLLVVTSNSYIPWTEQHSPLRLMLSGNVTTCYLHILLSKNICQVIFVPNGVCPLTVDVRDIFIYMHYFCSCYM